MSLLGIPAEFEFEGRTYPVAPRDLECEGRFARWVAEETHKAIEDLADTMGPQLLQLQLEGFRHDLAGKLYTFGSYIVQRALQSDDGQKHMALLQLGLASAKGKRPDRALIERVWKDRGKWAELKRKMAEATGEESPGGKTDPNAEAAPGGPSPPSSPPAGG